MHAMQDDGAGAGSDQNSGSNGYAEIIPAGQRKPRGPELRETVATAIGMLLPMLTRFGHHH